jgi:DNA replication initiation complex subunit (GINS family)
MYDELYYAWRLEMENNELNILSSDFYAKVADYLLRTKETIKMIDKSGLKTRLLERELANAERIVQELISTRYRKIFKMIFSGVEVPSGSLASEESQLCNGVVPSAEAYKKFAAAILHGKIVTVDVQSISNEPELVHKRVTLRFLKPVPSIIGLDMKSYGPFLVEDVASVPVENAKILVKQGLAKLVELQ